MASLSGVFNLQNFTDAGLPLASGRLYTFVQGTTTHKTAYTDAAGVVPQTYTSDGVGGQYIALDARGELPAPLYLAAGSYDLALKRSDGSSVWTRRADPTSDGAADVLTRLADSSDAAKGPALVAFNPALAYTDPESLGYQLPLATFRGTGGDDTTALQALLTAGYNVQLVGTIYANNLTASTAGQHIKGIGRARVIKNANGPLITFSASDQRSEGIEWRGDATTPTYTGANVVSTGANFGFILSGSRWAHGAALVLQGSNFLVLGQCDIIQSALLSSSYDIDCGLDGTARLYGRIIGIYTSQNTGGIRFTDTGSCCVSNSQFADLKVQSGGSGFLSGCNGGNYVGNRITGNISAGISSALFSSNLVGGSTVAFESGTSGHSFDDSNGCSVGTTITDSSNASNVIDLRLIAPATYTPTITGTGVVIGDAVCTGQATKRGRLCTVAFRIVMGATTNFGSGTWSISLPHIPSSTIAYWGQVRATDTGTAYYMGAIATSSSGVAEAQITGDGAVGQYNNARPFTWVAGDVLEGSITYVTAT